MIFVQAVFATVVYQCKSLFYQFWPESSSSVYQLSNKGI